ncbi:MAG: type VII secretion protein EssC [Clostridium sp.]|nr:type VII secretion protein EssC [Clostridium sp.]
MRDIKNVLILFNNDFYKETDIDSYENNELIISNDIDSDIPLNIDVNLNFSLKLTKNCGYWEISEGENVYLVINDIKVSSKKLLHGDQVSVKLSTNRIELFKINFFLDFSSGKENYDKIVYFDNNEQITIGSDEDNNICIQDTLVDKHHCYIKKDGRKYSIVDTNSRYSVHINGKKINRQAKLNINDFIIICGYKFLFKGDRLLLNNYSNTITIKNLDVSVNEIAKSTLQYPEFIRNPRYMYNLPDDKIEIIAPPKKDKKPSAETFTALIPTIAMMALMISVRAGSNKIYYIGMIGITIFSTVLMYIMKYRKTSKKIKERDEKYLSYLQDQETKVNELYNEQQRISHILYPSNEESIEVVESFNHRLWEKEIFHDDFLSVCIGKGVVPISFEVEIPKEQWGETEDDLILLPRELKDKYKEIKDMPITLDLTKEDGVALIGEKIDLYQFVVNIIIQIVSYHYYEDVKLALICDDDEKDQWQWLRWLPHVWSADKKFRFLGEGKEAAHNVMSVLVNYFEAMKENQGNNKEKERKVKPYFIILVTNPELLDKEKLSTYLESANGIGYTPIFLYEHFEKTPKNCSVKIKLYNKEEGEMVHFNKAEEIVRFTYKASNLNNYEEFARRIAPIYVKQSYTDSSLPKSITFFELYKVNSAREIPIYKNWNRNQVFKHIAAPLGVDTSGNLISLDLHEKFHGPHGLVAGTTGSGKSEILQSLIASLAVNYHPHDINFILIDYKGGGMANLFRDLPHLVGTITNLDGRGINRSLIAIKSELKRRQRMFGEVDVNHIDDYIKLYKEGKVKEAIPHLIMIADEFAELKHDQPEFMQELVSTARIGRSLGVHLILATQKPSGVVNDQIWSNSKFKLCLKVQDASDSNEVLKSKLAADIVEPGRAYLQVGNNEIFELFQSAWSGAKVFEDDTIRKNDIEISKVSIEGIRQVIYSSKKENEGKKAITELDQVIRTVNNIARKNNIEKLQGPWLPELAEVIFLSDMQEESKGYNNSSDITAVIGKVDDPEGQVQYPLEINFTKRGNVILIGGAGYGKTTTLETMIVSLAKKYQPKDVNIYILDFGTRVLKVFEKLPHVGGVILKDDDEKLVRLIRLIRKEMEVRKDMFSKVGVASLNSYKEATGIDLPQMIIIVDNFVAMKEMYDFAEEELTYISREGITLGISVVLSTAGFNNIRYKMASNFNEMLALPCQDKSEYSAMFGTSRVNPANIRGRVLLKTDRIIEAQVCLPVLGESDIERVNALKEFIETTAQNTKGKAKKIPFMPEQLHFSDMEEYNGREGIIPVGITYDDIEERVINLNEHPFAVIIGKDKSGKTNFIKNVISTLSVDDNVIYAFDSKKMALRNVKNLENVKYICSTDDTEEIFNEIMDIVNERSEKYNEGLLDDNFDEAALLKTFTRIMIVVDNLKDFVEYTDKKRREDFNTIITKHRELKINIMISSDDAGYKELLYAEPFLKKLKEEQFGLLFTDLDAQKTFDVYLKYGRKKEVLKDGDGFIINKGKFEFVKTPLSDM